MKKNKTNHFTNQSLVQVFERENIDQNEWKKNNKNVDIDNNIYIVWMVEKEKTE